MNKQEKIVTMFDEIAKTYDVANRVLSFGVDKSWRRDACVKTYEYLDKNSLQSIVDVACGTGDMCEYWDLIAKEKGISLDKIIGIDPSSGMLEEAKKKGLNAQFIQAQAKDIPLNDDSSDIVSISYGLRNVVDREDALREFYRVLKSGGYLVILEFTKLPKKNIGSKARDFYMKRVLPIVGGILSKNFNAYSYLPNSIEEFLTSQKLVEELKETGFEIVEVKGYSMDISTLFIAKKP